MNGGVVRGENRKGFQVDGSEKNYRYPYSRT